MQLEKLHHKKIAILGYGKEGRSTLAFLLKEGLQADYTILDINPVIDLPDEVKSISWGSYLDTLWNFDYIFKTPGISPFHEKILPYKDKLLSQAHIFFSRYRGKVIGITGTKGKSTIASLTYKSLLEMWYKVKLAGNIGLPILDEVRSWEQYDYIIYELSSYMLQDFSPELYIWYLNNIYPCHLDWHESMECYIEAKLNIVKAARHKIISPAARDYTSGLKFVTFWEWTSYYTTSEGFFIDGALVSLRDGIQLQWEHNIQNILGVMAILNYVSDDVSLISSGLSKTLSNFCGLPDRIENIGVYEWITFINDAIATTPQSTMAAIETFLPKLQTLFIWWENSGFEFDDLRARILSSSIQNIIAFPDTSELIFPEIEHRDYDKAFEIEIEWNTYQMIKTRDMRAAVDFAYKTTFAWKIALLSCAAPSFSVWDNYRQKAELFKEAVKKYS